MEPIQFAAILFALFSLSRVILRYRDKKVSFQELVFWCVIWLGVVIVAVRPSSLNWLSNVFGVGRPLDSVVYVSIIILFYLVFRIYVKIRNMEQNITTVVREIAKNRKRKK